jgi:hypothetical protein
VYSATARLAGRSPCCFLGLSGEPLSPRPQRLQNLKQAQKLIYRAVCIQCFSVQRCVSAKFCAEVRRRVDRHRRLEIWRDKAHRDAPIRDLFSFPDTDFERYIKVEAHIAQRCRQSAIGNFLGVTAIICLKGFGYNLAQLPPLIGKPDEFELAILCDAKDENLVGVGVSGRREGGFTDCEVRIAFEPRRE